MMKRMVQAVVGIMLTSTVAAWAADKGAAWAPASPWSLRLGASYREFKDVDFKGTAFRNFGTQDNAVGPYGVQNVTTIPGASVGTPVLLDYIGGGDFSGSTKSGDGWAPVLGFGWDFAQMDAIRIGLVGNLQYYSFEVKTDGAASYQQFRHLVLGAGALSPAMAQIDPPVAGTTFAAESKLEMDIWVLDLGLQASADVSRFTFNVAAGPTVTFTDADSSQAQNAAWGAQAAGLLPAGGFASENSESDSGATLGVYGAVGVTVRINKNWAVGAEYRYDYVSDEAGPDSAKLDLSGSSAQVKVIFNF